MMNDDPTRLLSEGLGGAAMLGGAKGTIGRLLGGATKSLLGIDLADQEIPGLDVITDGLTVAAGIGSLIASAFDSGGPEPEAPKDPGQSGVSGSFGV